MSEPRKAQIVLKVDEQLLIDLELESVADLLRVDLLKELRKLTEDEVFQANLAAERDRIARRITDSQLAIAALNQKEPKPSISNQYVRPIED